MKLRVEFDNAGLYGVYVGVMFGQFFDGYWENSNYHRQDLNYMDLSEVRLVHDMYATPVTRYNMDDFFKYIQKENCTMIIRKVLSIWDHADLIRKVYSKKGKEKADKLIDALTGVYVPVGDLRIYDEYFGGFVNFKNELREDITKEDIKLFRSIGSQLNKHFKHVKTHWELVDEGYNKHFKPAKKFAGVCY